MKFKMGSTVKDRVTGFKGLVTGRTTYITGCDQYLVQPKIGEKSEWIDCRWFDENRLVVVGKKVVHLDTEPESKGPDKPAPRK